MVYNEASAEEIVRVLLKVKALRLETQDYFTWSSGWKSPIYCDNRKLLSFPEERGIVKEKFIELINEKYPEVEIIAGVATAGIAHAAFIADAMKLPLCYVRSKAKGHGMENLIEGDYSEGMKTVVVEDLISTGGSTIKAVEALTEVKADVRGAVAIFSYGFPQAVENFQNIDCSYYTLSNYEHLLPYALEQNMISETELELLSAWRTNPSKFAQ